MYTKEKVLKYTEMKQEIFDSLGPREQGSILGCAVEPYTTERRGAILTDEPGSDMIENGKEIEIKSSWKFNKGNIRWGGMFSKYRKCDGFFLIDGVNNRVYQPDHDTVFNKCRLDNAGGKGELRGTKANMEILLPFETFGHLEEDDFDWRKEKTFSG